jgi:hypothetical protein
VLASTYIPCAVDRAIHPHRFQPTLFYIPRPRLFLTDLIIDGAAGYGLYRRAAVGVNFGASLALKNVDVINANAFGYSPKGVCAKPTLTFG